MDNAPVATTVQLPQSGVVAGFNRLGIFRQIGLMVGLAASIAIGFAVVLWSQEPEYRPLMTNLDNVDASQIIQTLQTNQIKYSIDTTTGVLMVEADQIHNARLKLAAEGLSGKENIGFELLDQESDLGTSQFMETTRFKRGLEGELARTVSNLLPVKTARVHIAMPKESVFVRDARKPTASVFVQLYAGRSLNRVQVESIANLVASSIPELDPKDVTVVDQKGQLLNRQDADTEVEMVAHQLEYIRKVEDRLAQRVRGILEPVIGSGRFKAEVSADVDFTAIEQTDELFNPDLPALRSEQSLEENRAAGSVGGVPGALANQPPGAAAIPEQGAPGLQNGGIGGATNGSSRSQTTRNFELDRTISYTRYQQGRIQRLTVAVAVDDIVSINENGDVSRTPWSDADLQRLTVLVRDAVGYSAARGDSVNVVNAAFATPEPMEALPELAIWEQGWFWDVMKSVGAVLFLLILVFGVLRPILKSLSSVPDIELATAAGSIGELEGIPETDVASTGGGGSSSAGLNLDDENMLPGPNESYERQLAAVRSLVAEDPGRVAQVVKRWISADE